MTTTYDKDGAFIEVTENGIVHRRSIRWEDCLVSVPSGSYEKVDSVYVNGSDQMVLVLEDESEIIVATHPTARVASAVVAASDAPAKRKSQADYICDGTDDQEELQEAYDASTRGNIAVTEGTYNFSAPFRQADNNETVLSGVYGATHFRLDDGANCNIIEIGNIVSSISRVVIENIQLLGNSANNTSGSGIVAWRIVPDLFINRVLILDFAEHLIELNGCRAVKIWGEFGQSGLSALLVTNKFEPVRGLWVRDSTFELCNDNIELSILQNDDFSGIHLFNIEHRLNKGRCIVLNGTHYPVTGRPPIIEIRGNHGQTYSGGVATLIEQETDVWDSAYIDLGGGNVLVGSDPTNPPVAGGKGIYITSPYIKGDVQVESIVFDLSGGAADVPVFHAGVNCRLLKAQVYYPEASSADAGVVIRIGKEGDDNYYWTATSEISKAQWYEKEIPVSDLLQTDIPAGQTVTCGVAGGKTGTGEVKFVLEIAKFID